MRDIANAARPYSCRQASGAKLRFFFQAEDGIRDLTVTGVQTCALPISRLDHHLDGEAPAVGGHRVRRGHDGAHAARSEERRVGKECRSRGARLHPNTKFAFLSTLRWTDSSNARPVSG